MVEPTQTKPEHSKSEHWSTYTWRPFIGYCFGVVAVIAVLVVLVTYIGVVFLNANPNLLAQIPAMLGALAAILATLSPVLTVASYWRGKMQATPTTTTDTDNKA